MDFNNGLPWKWHREKSSNHADMAPFSLNGVSKSTEHMSCVCDEATPVKDCGGFDYCDSGSGEIYSPAKRRRVIFTTSAIARCLSGKEISSPFIKSKDLVYSVEADIHESPYTDVASPIDDSTDRYSEEWLADCLDEATINSSLDHMSLSGTSVVQNDISGLSNMPPQHKAKAVQECTIKTPPKMVFKGLNSDILRDNDVASSFAYPFAFVKPYEILGGITLDDINQRIHAPPPAPANLQINEENPYDSYPRSAFSGKPVVLKTKIHTEGRKGSITIMRTKG